MLKELAGSSWGQDKETLLLTYNALGKSIASYAAPVWSTNVSDSSFKKIQTAQNAADHLHTESITLKVRDHSDMLSTQYLLTVWRRSTSVMISQLKSQDPDRRLSTLDIIQLFFLDSAQAGRKPPKHAHKLGRFGHSSPWQQQST